MATGFTTERVLSVQHWSDRLFSIVCTRDSGFRFQNGQFVMMGLEVEGRPLMRAYSMASANYDDTLEFYSIKLQDGPLTSRLQKVAPGDQVLVGTKAVGTLTVANLRPGRHLWMLATGTGLAPFLSMVKDPETWERFERVTVVHGCRHVNDLSYSKFFEEVLPNDPYLGELVREKLTYFPTVTREPFRNQGRITDLLRAKPLSPEHDRVVICGSHEMIKETATILEGFGFQEGDSHERGDFLIEKAFASR
ncbi:MULTISPECIES: ferredoxin--NADP reductase [Myxococcus]|uniref:ferredoxin--NADP(+) reductase n=1 Tax=Myxococcus virescens TaxID=83456 RepID=A0A511HCW9_9BACT|nr:MULTISPECIES: ferredoxin--NADP reductase [Myxococcus]WNZ60185.1 ferredoxin--NADP reductase [Myxococcus sp. MxC21-1]GEL71398.1 ferredoxin--NADP(+) reductase [Myxococcus virescens]SDE08140.1 ferredoxin--NADP+ reductase [Myxococcus virescens]